MRPILIFLKIKSVYDVQLCPAVGKDNRIRAGSLGGIKGQIPPPPPSVCVCVNSYHS